MIQHVAGGDGGHARGARGIGDALQADGIVGAVHQRQGHIGAIAESRLSGGAMFASVGARAEDADQALRRRGQISPVQRSHVPLPARSLPSVSRRDRRE